MDRPSRLDYRFLAEDIVLEERVAIFGNLFENLFADETSSKNKKEFHIFDNLRPDGRSVRSGCGKFLGIEANLNTSFCQYASQRSFSLDAETDIGGFVVRNSDVTVAHSL